MNKQNPLLSHDELEGAITSEDVLGKDVIDVKGAFIGVSSALHLDPKSLQVLGLSVDKGFLRKGLVIGADYIKEITPHAVFLSVRPAFQLKGMKVFDSEGSVVGTVHEVTLEDERNEVLALIVKRGSKELVIPANLISSVEDNVFLSVKSEDIGEHAA
jgi:sporulation protein YlmC with PRC-barrel domain